MPGVGIYAGMMCHRALDVRLAAERVDAAAGTTDVAQQQLGDSHGTDVLPADGVLGHTHRVHDGPGLLRRTCGAIGRVDLKQDIERDTRDGRDELRRVPAVVLLHEIEHTLRVAESHVLRGDFIRGH